MRQKIDQIVIRIDDVPKDVESKFFKRHTIPGRYDIMLYEYVPRKALDFDKLILTVIGDLKGSLGAEILSLRKKGLNPVFHIDVPSMRLRFFWMTLRREDVSRLARRNVGLCIGTCTEANEFEQIMCLPAYLIHELARYGFSLEVC